MTFCQLYANTMNNKGTRQPFVLAHRASVGEFRVTTYTVSLCLAVAKCFQLLQYSLKHLIHAFLLRIDLNPYIFCCLDFLLP